MTLVATLVRTIHCPTHCLQDRSRQQHNQQQCQLLHRICAHGCKVQRASRIEPQPTPHVRNVRCGCARVKVAAATTHLHLRCEGVLQDTGAKGDGGGCGNCNLFRPFDLSYRRSHCASCSQPHIIDTQAGLPMLSLRQSESPHHLQESIGRRMLPWHSGRCSRNPCWRCPSTPAG